MAVATTKKTVRKSSKSYQGFSKEELAAMKDYLQEKKTAGKRGSKPNKEEDESAVLAKIAELEEPDRSTSRRIHELIKASVPSLSPRLWYGMPAYARDGKVICFFQPANKFKTRYSTLGFSDKARLDEGDLWPVAYAVNKLTPAVEARIAALVKRAAG